MWFRRISSLRAPAAILRPFARFILKNRRLFLFLPRAMCGIVLGGGGGGDQFRFVMQIENVDFREALRVLAERVGVELRPENPNERNERDRLFHVLELAAKFYEAGLKRYPDVEAYLLRRGVAKETMQTFRLGYAPPETASWRAFTEYALKKGCKQEELIKAGLAIQKQQDANLGSTHYSLQTTHSYDRFRNRIMFPIADANGRVIGFGGRIFSTKGGSASGGDTPQNENIKTNSSETGDTIPAKYINTPQTPLYDKSAVLYAFDKAKMAIRKENNCVIVEGYMDAIMAHQAGTAHTVAVSGTALTNRQLTMLRRLCDKVSMSFDMDAAGEMATRRSIDLALEMGFDVKALSFSEGKDPADLVAKDPVLWQNAVSSGVDVISYFLTKALGRFNSRTLEGKRGITASVLPLVARLPQEVDKAHWVGRVATQLGVPETAVWQDVAKEAARFRSSGSSFSQAGAAEQPRTPVAQERTRMRRLEERMMGLLCTYGVARFPAASAALFLSDDTQALFSALRGSADGRAAIASLPEERLRAFANQLIFETEVLTPEENADAEFASCTVELRREGVKGKLEQLTYDIKKAEEAGNAQQVSVLVDEFSSLSRELTKIS